MSAADLLAVLVGRHFRYDWDEPASSGNDHLIFSKGHASPLLYSVFKAVGVVSDDELMTGYRRFGSRLEGHPTPVLPWVDVATGSLGQGLPDAVGIALAGKYLDEAPFRVWVLCGDSEMAEGSIWEAFDKASHYKLSNLIVMVDVNRLGQRARPICPGTWRPTATGPRHSAPVSSPWTAMTWRRSTRPWPRRAIRAVTSRQ
jgi:transketolase